MSRIPALYEKPDSISETHTWNFDPQRWQYGFAKYLAELEVQRAVTLGLDAVIVNPSSVFGPGDILRSQSSVIHMVAERGLRLSAPGGMNVVHIADVVRGHLAALEHGRRGERYILGGENIPHERFFHTILDTAGIQAHLINLPLPLIRLCANYSFSHPDYFIWISIRAYSIWPVIIFTMTSKNPSSSLDLPAPLSARQAVADANQWFKEHPNLC